MLPKGLSNHTKFATYFLNMGLTPPPFLNNVKKNADLVEEVTPNLFLCGTKKDNFQNMLILNWIDSNAI